MTLEELIAEAEVGRFKHVLREIREAPRLFGEDGHWEGRKLTHDEVQLEKTLFNSEPRLARIWLLENGPDIIETHHISHFNIARKGNKDAWIAKALSGSHILRHGVKPSLRNPLKNIACTYAHVELQNFHKHLPLVGFFRRGIEYDHGEFKHWQYKTPLDELRGAENDPSSFAIALVLRLPGGQDLIKRFYADVLGVKVKRLTFIDDGNGDSGTWVMTLDLSGKLSLAIVASHVEAGKKRAIREELLRGETVYKQNLNVTIALLGKKLGKLEGSQVAAAPALKSIWAFANDYESFLEGSMFKRHRAV